MKVWIIFFIFGMFMFIIFGFLHEKVHQVIFSNNNIKSRIGFDWSTFGMATYTEEPCESDNCLVANEFNEVVGYHLMAIYALLFMGLFFIILLIENDYHI